MPGRKIRRSAAFSSIIRSDEDTIWTDIDTNAGSTVAEISTSTSVATARVNLILAFFLNAGIVVERYSIAGVAHYYTGGDWATLIRNNLDAARDWVRDPRAATGSITATSKANLLDGETFTVNDGVNSAVIFEFDITGDGVTGGNIAIDLSGGGFNAEKTRDEIVTAINAAASLDITATFHPTSDKIAVLTNDANGTAGNQSITDTVADAGFTNTDMSGGLNDNSALRESDLATDLSVDEAVAVALADILQNETIAVSGQE